MKLEFRAWNSRRKEMIYQFDLSEGVRQHFLTFQGSNELSICTGLKDKVGKSIYDGDILRTEEKTDEGVAVSYQQVFFDEKVGQWMLDCSLCQNVSSSYALFKELEDFDYRVAGNIFENPEMLGPDFRNKILTYPCVNPKCDGMTEYALNPCSKCKEKFKEWEKSNKVKHFD